MGMGFEELPHTADCALRVWAPDLASLFAEAALGLNFIGGAHLGRGQRVSRQISIQAADPESLLIAFLSELIYAQEHEALAFDEFHLRVAAHTLAGKIKGSKLLSLTRPIKAATFHNIQIRETHRGMEVDVIFDV